MRHLIVALVGIVFVLSAVTAQTTTQWEGYLADQMCGSNWKGAKGEERAAKHSRACGLEESCAASGYGIFTGGAFVKFTDASAPKAKAYLESITAKNKILVKVSGSLDGDKISVASIQTAGAKADPKAAPAKKSKGPQGSSSDGCECCKDSGSSSKHGSAGHTCDGECSKQNG